MEPILNRAEIADLLSSIRKGQISLDLEEEQDHFLECTPVNLFHLSRPDKEQFRIPNFDIILDTFCRQYATSLTNQLQRTFSINRVALETFEFQKFMADKPKTGVIAILDIPPLKHGALIFYDPKLSFTMLESMLGASSDIETLELERQLTTIELNILKTPLGDACSDIDKAFSPLLETNTHLVKLESNARRVSIVDADAEVVVGTLNVKGGPCAGEIHIVFPFATLEPLRESLKELLNVSSQTTSNWHEIIEEHLQDMPVTVIAQSGTIAMSVEKVLGLQVGDVINLDYDPNSPVQVMIENRPKYYALPGTHNGKKAISLRGSY